jgi:HK97 family phage portal protein
MKQKLKQLKPLFTNNMGANVASAQPKEAKASVPSWYGSLQTFVQSPNTAVWSGRDYRKFADEAYRRNVVANRAVSLIAMGVANCSLLAFQTTNEGVREEVMMHPMLHLLHNPNPMQGKYQFLETLISYYLLAGDAFILSVNASDSPPRELHLLRPDRIKVVAGKNSVPQGYIYKNDVSEKYYKVDMLSGASKILHIKQFNPLNDWHGLASVEPAAYAIDQHNQAAAWNQALLQNGARPSGALVVASNEQGSRLSEEQYWRLKNQIDEQFSGAQNAGRPLLLEGGLEWKEMSLSPRDMDFLNIKHSAARDIALAFGVPPQLLGIPGDNTYSNLAEARLSLWEQTILPLTSLILTSLARYLNPLFGSNLELEIDMDNISALSLRRDKLWQQVKGADFLTADEKRQMLGFGN